MLLFIVAGLEAKPKITKYRDHSWIYGGYLQVDEYPSHNSSSVLTAVDVRCLGNGNLLCKTDYAMVLNDPINGFTEPEKNLIDIMFAYCEGQQDNNGVPNGSYSQPISIAYNGYTYQFMYTAVWFYDSNGDSVIEISSELLNSNPTLN